MKDYETTSKLFGIEKHYESLKKLHGDGWQRRVDLYETNIRKIMELDKCDIMEAALYLAELLFDSGRDSSELLSVAFHLCRQEDED